MTTAPITLSAPSPTTRSELRELVRLSMPIAGAQLALMLMGLVDIAILGQAGKVELAGAGIGRNLSFLAQAFSMGAAMALEPLASQALGAGDHAQAHAALRSVLRALLWLFPACALGAAALSLTLGPLGVDPVAIPIAQKFLFACAPSMLFYTVFLACKTYLQALGKMRAVVVASIVANVVNFAVCLLLVRGSRALGLPPLGALGSGLAMSISAGVLAGLSLLAVRGSSSAHREVAGPSVAAITKLGTPIALTLIAEMGAFVLASVLVGRLGPAVTSAHQVALSLASFTFMGALGVSGATAVRVGRAVGEGIAPRQRGVLGIMLGGLVMMSGVLAFTLIPRTLMRFFSPEPDVVAIGVPLLTIAAVFQLFDGVQCVAGGALRGAGDLRFAFLGGVIGYWLIGLPVALVLGFGLGWGAPGLWWGLTLGLVVVAVIFTTRFWLLSKDPIARIEA